VKAVGEIDSRRLVRHPLGKTGEQFDHAGPILWQEKACPDLTRVADGGLSLSFAGAMPS
jgi:hypothetical protein